MKNDMTKPGSLKQWMGLVMLIGWFIFPLMGCLDNNEMTFDSLKKHFEEDYNVIDKAIKSEQYSNLESLDWIESVYSNVHYVECSCGGSGMGSQTNYTGFFYTPHDDPFAMWRSYVSPGGLSAKDFTETEDGWVYRQPQGDNEFIAKKLAPGYYYFFEHY